ncbi:scavenger receptor cysteine-rich type 1 protein M130-like [Sphaeramia orbicularis]|uniref:scavenger receptor cysteine-rich type 1 protein M130-like n=1 Tax=Sphaeramia orbicularis TaxID=375764 RepID=UPI00117CA3FE|nr:scavenger receptor cysteine-rich type 1 protein M130-like [Sphaeramia orbicularis]
MRTGAVVCSLLDCGSPVSLRRKVDSFHTMWSITPSCIHSASSLWDCVTTQNAHSAYQLEITCSDSVRLVHGSSVCSGRLEVQSNLTWSSVCEEHFDLCDAEVVCRELGCGPPSVLQGALYGEPETSVWKMFQCEGHEAALLHCGGSVSDTCSSGKAVELTCSDSNIRLVGGSSPCDGSVQLKQHGEWRDLTVYDWTLKAVSVICGQLNCGSPISMKEKHDSERPVWNISPSCVQSVSTLRDCITAADITAHSSLDITCSDSVRLVHGSSLCSGRLEIQWDQSSWSSVCEEHIHVQDAEVVCRELGCGSPSVLHGVLYEEGEVPVWTSELQCEGNESSFLDCKASGSFGKTCLSGKAAGLTCSEPVRLVGQPSRCAGTLEIYHQGQWRPVGTSFQSDLQSAAAVCRHLDCGSAVSVNSTNEVYDIPMWVISSACVKLTSALQDCIKLYSNGYVSTLEVLCSDILVQPNISLSSSNDLVSEAQPQMFQVPMGSSFTITCSVQPQYRGGSFQLISDTSEPQNHTLPAVNHSAHFLFSAADHTHQGGYTCVYHINVFNQNFSSSKSEVLHLTVSAPVTTLIICLVIIILILLIFTISLHVYCKQGAAQTTGFSLKKEKRGGFPNPDL